MQTSRKQKKNSCKVRTAKHAYNDLTVVVKWFLFHMGFTHIVDIMNYIYNEAKLPVPIIRYKSAVSTCIISWFFQQQNITSVHFLQLFNIWIWQFASQLCIVHPVF